MDTAALPISGVDDPTLTPAMVRAALERAERICESQTAMAARIGVTQSAAAHWKLKGVVPMKRALQIEALTKGAVRKEQLCPDFLQSSPGEGLPLQQPLPLESGP
ncbi:MAG TPA: Cro/CI family transcriptional regulator [Azospirillaceae bacterium]|nr:Cro/CI family transcriptional regulator [Azospirillaceae bacterium]